MRPGSLPCGPGCLASLRVQLAKSGVCWGGPEHVLLAPCSAPRSDPAGTQAWSPTPACQGLPSWLRPCWAAVPCQAGAEPLQSCLRLPLRWLWPFWLSGQQALGPCVSSPEPLAEPCCVSLSPSACLGPRCPGELFPGWLRAPPRLSASGFPSVQRTCPVGCLIRLGLHSGERLSLGPLRRQTSNRPSPGLPQASGCSVWTSGRAAARSGPGKAASPLAAAAAVSRQLGRPGRAPEARSGLTCAPGRPAAGGGAAWWEV